jgi:hypothetical protein
MSDYLIELPHKNREKVPIYSHFGLKKAKKHDFLLF